MIWQHALNTDDQQRVVEVIDFAETGMTPREIGTGATNDLGLGPQFNLTLSVNIVLQRMADRPGHGGALVLAALHSPVISNRNTATSTLLSWARAHWPPGADAAVGHLAATDPDDSLRARAAELLTI